MQLEENLPMNDPYVYPNTNVLINKMDLKDNEALDRYENVITNLSLVKLFENNPSINHISDVQMIHKSIFIDIYDWAGVYRTINIYKSEEVINGKSVEYTNYRLISNEINQLNTEIKDFNWDVTNQMLFVQRLAYFISKLWKIHPFREGNTRTTVTYFVLCLKQKNIAIDEQMLKKHAAYFRNSLVMASIGIHSEMGYLENILYDALFSDNNKSLVETNSKKYSTINGYDISKYKYNYHSTKK